MGYFCIYTHDCDVSLDPGAIAAILAYWHDDPRPGFTVRLSGRDRGRHLALAFAGAVSEGEQPLEAKLR
jgi:hypothetical protein